MTSVRANTDGAKPLVKNELLATCGWKFSGSPEKLPYVFAKASTRGAERWVRSGN